MSKAAWFRLMPMAVLALVAGSTGSATGQAGGAEPFTVKRVANFVYPWRIAFLPDGRMLVTEKPGHVWLVEADGTKLPISGVPGVAYGGQGGLLGIYTAPAFSSDRAVYLTYSEPGGRGSGLALARATLVLERRGGRLEGLRVVWREFPKGRGGQFGGAVAFARDGRSLFLTVGDRQRMAPAQDPDLPQGKILHLTLDGQPAPGNPAAGKVGARTAPLIDPPRDTIAAQTAPVVARLAWPGANRTPAETWASGVRTPYGLAYAPDGRLWEIEHGPRGGDELNLIEPGRNYGWPLVSWGVNYDGAPIPKPGTRPDLTAPVLQWTPVIGPGNFIFCSGRMFPTWRGSLLVAGLVSRAVDRVTIDSRGRAQVIARYALGFRARDIAEAPDGALWVIADANPGGLYRLTPPAAGTAPR